MKTISIIVPCYNEEQMLDIFYDSCSKVTSNIHDYIFEYIFINDGSNDNTLNILKRLSKTDDRIKYVSLSRNFGKEAAILAGLKSVKSDYVILMDADLQHPPELIPIMIENIKCGFDSVAVKRLLRKGEKGYRKIFSKMFYKIINKISDIDIPRGATDYRIISKQIVDSVVSLGEYHRFTKGIFEWVGYNTKWIEYESESRAMGNSKWSFKNLFNYAIEGIVSFSTTPLKISSIIGFIFSFISFIYFIFTFLRTLALGKDMPGYASTICMITFLGGIQLIALGVIGEYLSKVYMETKQRPNYFIKETNIEKNELGE